MVSLIPEKLENMLQEIFAKFKINKNKDGNIALNEWGYSNDDVVDVDTSPSYNHYEFMITVYLDRKTAQRAEEKDEGLEYLLKQSFGIMEESRRNGENNSMLMNFKLKQAVLDC